MRAKKNHWITLFSPWQDGDPVTVWVDSARDDPVDGTVGDVGSGTPEYKADVLYGKPVVRFNGTEALSSVPFALPDVEAGATIVAVATGDKSGVLHERLGHFGARLATGGNLISMDVCSQQGTVQGSGFRLNNGYSLAGNPNPMDTDFHVGVWQASQGTRQADLIYYLDGVEYTLTANNSNNTVIFAETDNVVAVGDGYNPSGAFYPGDFVTADLAVFIVYNRVLSQAEVATLTEYLRNEYLVHQVAEATGGVPQPQTEISYTPAGLEADKTYYWRVDEFTVDGTVKGPVWSFTTIAEIPVQDDSLLGWWTMDQVDSVSIPDMSGHGRHGVIYGDVEWVEGIDGSAIQLDATDRIVVPVIDVNISTTTMTAWVRPDQIATSIKGIVYRRGGGSVGGLKIGPGNELGYTWNDNPNAYNWQSGLFVPAREWSFIALVLDPSQAALCLNGTSIQRTNTLEHLEMAFDQDMTIGHDPLDVGRRFVGARDDVRFYNRALSEDELADVLAAGTRPEREADPLMIEDFDAYNAYSDEGREDVWDVWADGYGGNGTGSTAGYVQEPFMSRSMVVNGGQALPLGYDNTGFLVNFEGKPAGSRLSEIVRSFSPVQDFTRGGATSVTFRLKGDQANTAEAGDALYLGVKDATGRGAVVTVGTAADLRKFYWVQKKVALSDLAGADLTKVTDLFLGVGTRAVPQTGGVGTILVDDITLVVE